MVADCAGAFGIVAALSATGQLRGLENAAADARARLLRRDVPSDIVIVGIDSASVQALETWPWPRRHHAKLLQNLTPAKPRRVFFDVDFSSPSNSLDDAMLDASLAKRRDFSVLLPAFTQYARGAEGQRIVSRPLPSFARSADLVAVNGEADASGVTREWRNYWTLAGERTPSVIDLDRVLQGEQSVTIDFSIAPESFTYVSFIDVLEGRVNSDVFENKTVFVGATALELGDVLAVPVYGSMPGIVLQAMAAETVNQGAPWHLPVWGSLALLAVVDVARHDVLRIEVAPQSQRARIVARHRGGSIAVCIQFQPPDARHGRAHVADPGVVRGGDGALAGNADLARSGLRGGHAAP